MILPAFSDATLLTVRAVLPADMGAIMKPRTDAEAIARRLYAQGYRAAVLRTEGQLAVAVARCLSGTGIALTATDATFAAIRSELERLTAAAIADPYDREHEAAMHAESARFLAQAQPLPSAAE